MMTKIFLMMIGVLFTWCNLPGSWYLNTETWEQGFKKNLFWLGLIICFLDFIWISLTGI